MHGIPYTFNDSGAAAAPPQQHPNQEMHGTLSTFINDSGAVGAPPQHYPNQEMHGVRSFSMIPEPPAPTTALPKPGDACNSIHLQ